MIRIQLFKLLYMLIGTVFGIGMIPVIPGTISSCFAVLLWCLLYKLFSLKFFF